MTKKNIRIATRKSPLALVQAEIVKLRLLEAFPNITAEIVPMDTTGDNNLNLVLAEIGGKGLFTKELEEGLMNGRLDIAVHSLKDMETTLPEGLTIAAMLEREDPRDALIAPRAKILADLPHGACVGTSSLRRAALLKIIRPDLVTIPFRGNIMTRLKKLESTGIDATMLAVAGLKRLKMENEATQILEAHAFLPAAGQGIIAVECRKDNEAMLDMLSAINHAPTHAAGTTERSMLATLDGSCRTPIGVYARLKENALVVDAIVANVDGTKHVRTSKTGVAENAFAMGKEIALELLANGGKECLAR